MQEPKLTPEEELKKNETIMQYQQKKLEAMQKELEETKRQLEEAKSNVIKPVEHPEYTANGLTMDGKMMRCIVPKNIRYVEGNSYIEACLKQLSSLPKHNAILNYYGSVLSSGNPLNFFVEFFENNLLDVLGDLAEEQIFQFADEILSGISSYAEKGQFPILQVDNIVICNGSAKILDKSINEVINRLRQNNLKHLGDLNRVTKILGHITRPPEHLKRRFIPNLSSTVYSYGLLLLYMFNGRELIEQLKNNTDKTLSEIIKERTNGILPSISTKCSQPFKDLILACLNPDPKARPNLETLRALIKDGVAALTTTKKLRNEDNSLFKKIPTDIFCKDLTPHLLFPIKTAKPGSDNNEEPQKAKSNNSAVPR